MAANYTATPDAEQGEVSLQMPQAPESRVSTPAADASGGDARRRVSFTGSPHRGIERRAEQLEEEEAIRARRMSIELREVTPHPGSRKNSKAQGAPMAAAVPLGNRFEDDGEGGLMLVVEDVDVLAPSLGASSSVAPAGVAHEGETFHPGASGGVVLRQPGMIDSPSASRRDPKRVGVNHVTYGRRHRGGSAQKRPLAVQKPDWDERHQLTQGENSMLPKGQRLFFSKPASLPNLRNELSHIRRISPPLEPTARTLLQKLDEQERPLQKPTPISADAGAATLPERHQLRGIMRDRDGQVRIWNDRWHAGLHIVNDGLHPIHRQYFSQDSVFQSSPSQRWRRHMDHEAKPGVWHENAQQRPPRFGPVGGDP